MESQNNINPDQTENINIKAILWPYLIHWKSFVISLIVGLTIAYVYLRYYTPIYQAATTIQVKDDRRGGMASELAVFSEMTKMSGVKNNVENEIEVLRSRSLMEKTISDLGLTVSFYSNGKIKLGDAYKNVPIDITWITSQKKESGSLLIQGINNNKFKLFDANNNLIGEFSYLQTIVLPFGKIIVTKQMLKKFNANYEYIVRFQPIKSIIGKYRGNLSITNLGKNTSVIELTLSDEVPEKAEDILDKLVENYNNDAIEDKRYVAQKTSKFIEDRLNLLAKELDDVENEVETFKKENNLIDIETEATIFRENASSFEKSSIENETKINIIKTLQQYVRQANVDVLLPANILSTEENASPLIEEYNQLVLLRTRQLKSAGPKNTVILQLEQKINALKENIEASLNQSLVNYNIVKKDLDAQRSLLTGKMAKVPTQEKLFKEIFRKQNIKDAIYSYLLEKREETEISLAATEPNAKVIDHALANVTPISPKKQIIYLAALLLGLILPAGVIYVLQLMDTKIKSRLDIEKNTTIPIVGDVPRAGEDEALLVEANSRTNTAEALRIIRTNLNFLLNDVPNDRAKLVFVTSTFPKEGKTFISVNLAATMALSEKKVLLIGMDI